MQQDDFNIVYFPGRIHGNADCLSRRPYDSCEISSLKKKEPQTPHTLEIRTRYPELVAMIDFEIMISYLLTIKMHARFCSQARTFILVKMVCFYHTDFNRRRNTRESFSQLVVPAALRFKILSNVHCHIAGAHFVLNKTFSKRKQR